MYKIYMGLWWFCFIQWPLFMLYAFLGISEFFNFPYKSLMERLETFYGAYMLLLPPPHLILPVILTIILAIRAWKGVTVSKLEKGLAIGSLVLSLFLTILIINAGIGLRT